MRQYRCRDPDGHLVTTESAMEADDAYLRGQRVEYSDFDGPWKLYADGRYADEVSTGQSDRYGHTDIEMHSLDFRGGGIDADAIADRLEASTDRRNTPRP